MREGSRFALHRKSKQGWNGLPACVRLALEIFLFFKSLELIGRHRLDEALVRLMRRLRRFFGNGLEFVRIKPNEIARLASVQLQRWILDGELKHLPAAKRALALSDGMSGVDFPQQAHAESIPGNRPNVRHRNRPPGATIAEIIEAIPFPNGFQLCAASRTSWHACILSSSCAPSITMPTAGL